MTAHPQNGAAGPPRLAALPGAPPEALGIPVPSLLHDQSPGGGTGPKPRAWTVVFPPGMEILTGNNRLHYYARAALIKALKETAWGQAKRLKLPQIERADVVIEYRPPAHRGPLCSAAIRDADNLAPTGKALVDGVTMAGIFPQDTAKHVRRVSYEFGPKSDRGQVLLHITEVES